MWFCIRPQIYNASAPHTCAWACASVYDMHFACYALHMVHKSWNPPRHWQGDQGLTPEPVLKINIWMQIFKSCTTEKIPTFSTSCFNYIVFRYWRVAWLVDPDLKIHYGQHFRFYHPLLVRILIVLIVWSMKKLSSTCTCKPPCPPQSRG